MTEVAPPPLPYVLRAGGVPVAAVRHRLVTIGPGLLLLVAIPGAIIGLASGRPGPALFAPAFVAGIMLLVAVIGLPILALYGRSTVTVTDREVVVHRLRTRRLARDEVGELVLGYFTIVPLHAGDMQACLTRRDGSRFITLPLLYWDRDGLARVAAALGVEARMQDARDERLRPFHVRHLWVTTFGGALVGVVAIVAAIVLFDAIAANHRRDDAAKVLRAWRAEQAPRLRALPGVRSIETETDRTSITADYGGGEIPAGRARRAHDLACAGRDPSLRIALRYVDRADPQQQAGRELRFTCERAADPGFVLDGLAAHPLPRAVRFASLELSPLTDFKDRVTGTRLQVFAQPSLSEADARATLCPLRAPRGELVLAGELDRC